MSSDAIKHIQKYIDQKAGCALFPLQTPHWTRYVLSTGDPQIRSKSLIGTLLKKELDKFKTVFLLHFKNPFKLHDCIKLPVYKHNLKIDKAFVWHKYPYKCVLLCMCFQLIPSLNFYFRVSWSFLLIFQSVALAFQMPFK